MKIVKNNTSGFTLIETLVAISILLVSITGPLTIASKGLQSAIYARDQITAFYLAQDAIEYIRNKRDSNTLSLATNWLAGFGVAGVAPDCTSAIKCLVDVKNDTITACSGDCQALRYNDSTGFYSYNGADPVSRFTREVQIVSVNPPDEVTIVVSIYWQTGTFVRSFTVKENIFNWQL